MATVTLTGELDDTSAAGVVERPMKAAEAHPERLVLDLGGLEFVDVAGGRALDRAYWAVEAGC
jgi:anti-anti-sigma regulatory factor